MKFRPKTIEDIIAECRRLGIKPTDIQPSGNSLTVSDSLTNQQKTDLRRVLRKHGFIEVVE